MKQIFSVLSVPQMVLPGLPDVFTILRDELYSGCISINTYLPGSYLAWSPCQHLVERFVIKTEAISDVCRNTFPHPDNNFSQHFIV